jgi:hypothetical protein
MPSKKLYDRNTKQAALVLWTACSALLLGAMLLPLYWYWDRLVARQSVFALIVCSLAWALFNWWKLASTTFKRIRTLPEQEA